MELTITHDAADAIRAVMGAKAGGIRITTVEHGSNGDGPGLALVPVPEPEPDDEVIEAEGAEVYVDAGALDALDGKVLDAEHEGEAVRFSIVDERAS